ncbi:DUF5641 domain-containing protein [Trichonephila clavata]|uniref:DUF5641 domain-containing protein n=1 Tax=Trichonephila clavata TaxID=2740835 RepID=A0A8X6LUD1_TRICU|nr:DUF5641 domain-containing protein [Trichonephila clavata]
MCCESYNYDNSESDIVPLFNCAVNKPILNIENFSTLHRLLRVTSLVFRFIYNARNSNNRRSGPITSSETSKALIYFIKMSQENSFSSEINNIKLNKSVNKNSKLCNFNVMIDDENSLRIKSRLTNSSLDVYEKHPIILSNDYFASLIVYGCHEKVLHNGVNETLIQVRIEAVINSRPLTYVYNDVNEPDPLTPSHFTVGSRLTTLPSPKLNSNSINV